MAPIIECETELGFAAKMEDEGNTTMRGWAGQAAAAMGLLGLCWTTGCGAFFVYPGSQNGGSTGSVLTALSGSPYQSGSAVDALAVDKTTGNTYLLAAAFGGAADLTEYSFDSTTAGKLDSAASTMTGVADPTGPVAIAVASVNSVNYVYVANQTANTVSGYSLSPTTLTQVANFTLPLLTASLPTSVAVNPANTFLYVGTSSGIYGFSILTGGALQALNGGSAVGLASVQSMDISPDGNWLLVLDGSVTSIDEFQINSTTGALAPAVGTPYSVSGATPRAIKIAPNGAYVFVALGTAGDIVFPFDSAFNSGALTTPPLTLAAPASPMSDNALAVSPNGSTLYIARSNSTLPGTIAAYSIGSGGALTLAATGTTGAQPYSVVVNAAGTDVYVANKNDGTISGFSTIATK